MHDFRIRLQYVCNCVCMLCEGLEGCLQFCMQEAATSTTILLSIHVTNSVHLTDCLRYPIYDLIHKPWRRIRGVQPDLMWEYV